MSVTPDFRAWAVEQLSVLGPVVAKSMFGGVGLYHDGLFFGLLDDDQIYLKVDDVNRPDFERAGTAPFKPYGDDSHVMQYYEVPADVLEDRDALRAWAAKAVDAARRAKAKPKPKSKRR